MSTFTIELDAEVDGRIIAEIPEIPGVLVYGTTKEEAVAKVQALALRVLADRVEHGEAREQMAVIFGLPPDASGFPAEQVST